MKHFDQNSLDTLLHQIINATRLDLSFSTQAHPGSVPDLTGEITGPDTPLLTARNAELLRAIEHLAFELRGLDPAQHDLISLDADNFKLRRKQALINLANRAAATVLATGRSYTFEPMSSHERRQLHLALTPTGLRTASVGEGPHRAVVLYPQSSQSH